MKGGFMKMDVEKGEWKIIKGRIRKMWSKLKRDGSGVARAEDELIEGEFQKAFGISQKKAKKRLKAWKQQLK